MLKSLELFGFKSFADKTRFEFAAGITGVVGPNGSGKSNVVDGIKWLLGDQSPKSLRGREMTDVIFNGAAGRGPSSFAEAMLTIDNSSGFLPVESSEICIGRRLWRSGDSEYLINGAASRLKDVRRLFMGTGAGSAAYCIIEQGRVDQILQASAVSRRTIFEEAAGISLFKSRKAEFLRRMERVEQMLARLTDIVDEVESRLNSLKSQAEKAAAHRRLSEELREAWLGLAADDYRHLGHRIEQHQRTAEELARKAASVEQRERELAEQLAEADRRIAQLDERLREIERSRSANRQTLAGQQATIVHQRSRLRELAGEVGRLRRQRAVLANRSREADCEIAHNGRVVEKCRLEHERVEAQLEQRRERISELQHRLSEKRETVERDRRTLLEAMRAVSESGSRVSGLETRLTAARDSRRTAESRRSELYERLAAAQADSLAGEESLAEAARLRRAAEERVREIESRRAALLDEEHASKQSLSERRERRSALQARIAVLEDLERRQEGLGIGVREILSRARTSHYPPWDRILGTVADLLEADLEQAALLEAALGERAQLIVIEELAPLIDYLHSGASRVTGRVGFFSPADAQEPGGRGHESGNRNQESGVRHEASGVGKQSAVGNQRTTDNEQRTTDDGPIDNRQSSVVNHQSSIIGLTGRPGVLQRADELVCSASGCPALPARLLADTWIVETLDVALELASGDGRNCRFVTLQGELLEADGRLIVGSLRSETALVSRKSELRGLKNDLLRLDREIEEQLRGLRQVGDSLCGVDDELSDADAELEAAGERCTEFSAQLAAQKAECDRLAGERDRAVAELERLGALIEELEADLQAARMEQIRLEEDVETVNAGIDQAERDIARYTHRLQTLQQRRSAEQLELARHEQRLQAARESFQRLQRDREQRLAQQQEAERRLSAGLAKRSQITLSILNTQAQLAELMLIDQELEAQALAVGDERADFRGDRSRLAKEESSLRRRRRELENELHRQELAVREAGQQLDTLAERIQEEYQVELAEVVENGASAYRSYLEETGSSSQRSAVSGQKSEDESEEAAGMSEAAAGGQGTTDDGQRTTDPPAFEDVRPELEARVNRLRRKLKMTGAVDTESLRDLDESQQRYDRLSATLNDLLEARKQLEDLVRRIDGRCREMFLETFEGVRRNFRELFRRAFGGGDGDIVLEDPDDVLECGIDIVARPPGKELKSLSLMSGGEKTLTAFALLLALFKFKPSPWCLLDEVDASLDEANVERLLALLGEFKQETQFVVITHKKPTMTIADVLYGVTMEESGVSRRLTVRFENIGENGEIRTDETPLPRAA